MKIIVLSDTHRYLKEARNVLKRIGDRVEMAVHLGDLVGDAERLQGEFPHIPFHYVLGNNDYGEDAPSHKMVMVKGCKLLLTHGHRQMVHWHYDTLSYWAEEQGADAVLFGHTHCAVNDVGGRIMLFNPGSISQPRDSQLPTFGILEVLEEGQINGAIMEVHGSDDFRIRSTTKSRFVKKV